MEKYAIHLQDPKTMNEVVVIVSGTSVDNAEENLENKSDYLDKYAILATTPVVDEIH